MLDRDAFLKLLVAQLKYQDPTKPADASQMVAQSAQLTMVDRLNEIASQLTAADVSALSAWLGGFNLFTYYTDNFLTVFAILVGSGIAIGALAWDAPAAVGRPRRAGFHVVRPELGAVSAVGQRNLHQEWAGRT